jgi:raffinose/stachyose/melibiose transport system substrate-binding protein
MIFLRAPVLRLAAALCVAVLTLAGCGSSGTTGSKTATLTVWYSTDDPVERIWSHQLAQQFEAAHPTVQVRFNALSFEDINTKLQLALNAGSPPDLAYVTPRGPGIPAYLRAHQLRDLTAAARSAGWARALRSGLLAAYNQPFVHYGAPAGHVMAVPTALAAVGLLYNRRLLHALHLAVPTTLAAFAHDLARASAAGDVPIGIGNADGWVGDDWYLTIVNALVSPAALQSEQVLDPHFNFLRPPFVTAAAMLRSWASKNYLTPDFGGLDAQEGIQEFFKGKTLFQLISSSQDAQILQLQRTTKLPVGVTAFPGGAAGGVMPQSGYLGWVIPAAAPHARLAVEFITSLLKPTTTRFLLKQGVIPAAVASPSDAAAGWQRDYMRAVAAARPGVYLDAAPIGNLNATMEANVQLLLQGYEAPSFLPRSLEEVYRGKHGSTARIDGEF